MHTQKDGLMATYHFTLEVSGIDPDVEGFEDRFYGNGVEDALIYVSDRRLFLAFDREAASERAAQTPPLRTCISVAGGS